MTRTPPQGYRPVQVALHWIVTGVVAFLFITGDSTTEAYFARLKGTVTNVRGEWLPVHLVLGLLVLVAMLWRLQLRWRAGVPQMPVTEPKPLRWLANAVHVGLYVDMVWRQSLASSSIFGSLHLQVCMNYLPVRYSSYLSDHM